MPWFCDCKTIKAAPFCWHFLKQIFGCHPFLPCDMKAKKQWLHIFQEPVENKMRGINTKLNSCNWAKYPEYRVHNAMVWNCVEKAHGGKATIVCPCRRRRRRRRRRATSYKSIVRSNVCVCIVLLARIAYGFVWIGVATTWQDETPSCLAAAAAANY